MVLVNSNSTKPSIFPSPPKLTLQDNTIKQPRKRKNTFESNQNEFKTLILDTSQNSESTPNIQQNDEEENEPPPLLHRGFFFKSNFCLFV